MSERQAPLGLELGGKEQVTYESKSRMVWSKWSHPVRCGRKMGLNEKPASVFGVRRLRAINGAEGQKMEKRGRVMVGRTVTGLKKKKKKKKTKGDEGQPIWNREDIAEGR